MAYIFLHIEMHVFAISLRIIVDVDLNADKIFVSRGQMDLKNLGRHIKDAVSGQREELTRIDTGGFTGQQFDSLVVRNSISLHIFQIALGLVITIFLFVPRNDGINLIDMFKLSWIWSTIIAAIPIAAFYLGIRGLMDREPKLIIDTDGIRTKDWAVTWAEIVETKFKFINGKTTCLIVKTRTTEQTIDIGATNIGPRFLGHHIELLKRRAG